MNGSTEGEEGQEELSPPARRALLHGAAWGVPILASVSTAPRAVASGQRAACASQGTLSVTSYESRPLDKPYSNKPGLPAVNPGFRQYGFRGRSRYVVEAKVVLAYAGSPVLASSLKMELEGSPTFIWEETGTPTVVSSAGNIGAGQVASQGGSAAQRSFTLLSSEGARGVVRHGDVLTVTWQQIATGAIYSSGGSASAFAFPCLYVTSCGAMVTPHIPSTVNPRAYNLYNYYRQ
ncbi:MAG: hypothetical protein ACTIA6_06350 [Pseudoclavibacter sp.]